MAQVCKVLAKDQASRSHTDGDTLKNYFKKLKVFSKLEGIPDTELVKGLNQITVLFLPAE